MSHSAYGSLLRPRAPLIGAAALAFAALALGALALGALALGAIALGATASKAIASKATALKASALVLLAFAAQTRAQDLIVTGTVIDQQSGAPISSARIAVIDIAAGDTLVADVLTDFQGRYSIVLPARVGTQRASLPVGYELLDIYPNPLAAGPIHIRYLTPVDGAEAPALYLYDVLGRRIDRPDALAAGIYFVRLQFDGGPLTDPKRFVLVRGGRVDLRLQAVSGTTSSMLTATAKRSAGNVHFVVEKEGFERLEQDVQFSGAEPAARDFSLERIDDGRARLVLRVADSEGELLSDVTATVVDDTVRGVSGEHGEIILDSVYTAVPVVVRLTKGGFTDQIVRTEVPPDRDVELVEATMRERAAAVTIQNIQEGGTAVGSDGARIELSENALVDATGDPVTGSIDAFLTPLDVTAEGGLEAFPGVFAGFEPNGALKLLLTYGVTDIVLEQNGAALNLADGQTAIIELPLYVERDERGEPLEEGESIPLWSLDEGTGLWVQETVGTVVTSPGSPTGYALRGQVSHFSVWNGDVAANPARVAVYTDPTYSSSRSSFSGVTVDGLLPGFRTVTDSRAGLASVEGSTLTTFVPPDIEVELAIETEPRVGPSGLEVCRWSEIIVAEPNSELELEAEFECGPLDTGGDNEQLESPAQIVRAIDPAGEIDTYYFESLPGYAALVSTCRSGPFSMLSGTVAARAPSEWTIGQSGFGSFCGRLTFELTEMGFYQILVDGTLNEPATYELLLDVGPLAPLDTPVGTSFDEDDTVARHFFRPEIGDEVTLSFGSDDVDVPVRGTVHLLDEGVNTAVLSAGSGHYGQTTFVVQEDRPYVLELDPGGAIGAYLVTATTLADPSPFSLEGDWTEVFGSMDFFGQRDFYSFDGEAGGLLNIVLDLSEARTQLTVKRPSQLFYDAVSHANVAHEPDEDELDTGPFLLTESGEWVVELSHPSRAFPGLDALIGGYAFRIYAPEVKSLTAGSAHEGSIEDTRTFDAYEFTLAAEQNLTIRTTLSGGGRVVTRVLDESGSQLGQTMVISPGEERTLPGQLGPGTYYVVVEPVDSALEYLLQLQLLD